MDGYRSKPGFSIKDEAHGITPEMWESASFPVSENDLPSYRPMTQEEIWILEAKINLAFHIKESVGDAMRDFNASLEDFKSKFRVGYEPILPKGRLCTREDLYNYISSVQGVKSVHITVGFMYVSIFVDMEHQLRRSPIPRLELIAEVRRVVTEYKTMGMQFKLIII